MTKNRQRMIMLIVLLSYLVILIDNSLVFTCSTEIGSSFNMSTTSIAWVSNAYALTFGGLLLLGGRLGDILNRKKVFIAGLLFFGFSSLAVSMAPNSAALIAFRAVQGCGAAIIAPATLAIIMDNFTGAAKIRAIIIYGAMSGIGMSIGLIIGAGITTIASWRYGFLINFPITILLAILTVMYIPNNPIQHLKLDYGGAFLSFIAITLIINGINGIGPKILSFVMGIILLGIFIYRETRAESKILPLEIFRSRHRDYAYLIRFIYAGAINGFWFFTPRMLQSVFHYSPIIVAVLFLPMTIINYLAGQWVNKLVVKFQQELIVTIGLVLTTIGFLLLAFLQPADNLAVSLIVPMIIIGFGQGLILSPITAMGIAGLSSTIGGIASSVINVMLQIGGIIGIAILSILPSQGTNIGNYHIQMIVVTIFSLVGLGIGLLAWQDARRK